MRNIFQTALVILLLALSNSAHAQTTKIEKCGSAKRVTCVVDGDTIWFKGEKIRMMGYDTPEPTTNICGGQREIDLATKASDRLVELLNTNQFTIARDGKDKYGRTLAIVRIGDRDVGDILVEENLARSWPDGAEFWCD